MLAWYFILAVLLLMALIQLFSNNGKKTFSGLKDYFPQFKTEVGEELSPADKRKTESLAEKISGKSIPYYETLLSFVLQSPNKLVAEWSIGENLKAELTEKYGEKFVLKNQAIIRIFHLNAVPKPYIEDLRINLDRGHAEIDFYAPGETLNGQIGILTDTDTFISLAQSNDVIVPKEN